VASRPNWKGYLKLSLVSCSIALYPAISSSERVSFNQINSKTGSWIKYNKVDADTGAEVESADIVKGYQVDKGGLRHGRRRRARGTANREQPHDRDRQVCAG
jgi:DNA end-binding protein Ku